MASSETTAMRDVPYRGVTEPMAPALMRQNHEWAMESLIEQLHTKGFTEIRAHHAPVIGFPGPHGARPGELAARTGRSKQHINILLGELEAAGYLIRQADAADARGKVIYLTERGMDLLVAVKDAVEQVENQWRQAIGERRFVALKRALQDLKAARPSPRRGDRTPRRPDARPATRSHSSRSC